MNKQTLGVYIVPDSDATIPSFSTEGSACFDIRAMLYTKSVLAYDAQNKQQEIFINKNDEMNTLTIPSGWRTLIPTGIVLDIPDGFSVRLHARSGLALQAGIVLSNAEGVIDSDYIQELMIMISVTGVSVEINSGLRICQGELVQNQPTNIEQLMYPPPQKTERVGGFGSTGI